MDYRSKESDRPYPAEKYIFVNGEDIELFINPPYGNNSDITKFTLGEKENTAYDAFMRENSSRRQQIDLLMQVLLAYDRPESKFYKQVEKEYETRRGHYNKWLKEQASKNKGLFTAKLFQFEHIPYVKWGGKEGEYTARLLENYFEGIDFSYPDIIRSRQLAVFMDNYMRLYGAQADTDEERSPLFVKAAGLACHKASKGHPKVYGWMVDYFYSGFEAYNVKDGMAMLKEHIENPDCLTSKKQQIAKRAEGMAKLVPGALAPDFTLTGADNTPFSFHGYKARGRYKLLLFWTTGCKGCLDFIKGMKGWYEQAENKEKLDIIAVNLDETEGGIKKWQEMSKTLIGWAHFQVKEGVNSQPANNYSVLSTPVIFLVNAADNKIAANPDDFNGFIRVLDENGI
ncbi:MAG: TlpA disulfide reductase family protein [Candidatus Omnitrophica bacterium]|nr:TlpA disulfide reductase family protein [Candidatus Omnitrophota bacterium]